MAERHSLSAVLLQQQYRRLWPGYIVNAPEVILGCNEEIGIAIDESEREVIPANVPVRLKATCVERSSKGEGSSKEKTLVASNTLRLKGKGGIGNLEVSEEPTTRFIRKPDKRNEEDKETGDSCGRVHCCLLLPSVFSLVSNRSAQTMTTPEPLDRDYRVFGYLLNEEVLLKFALKHHLGTDEDRSQRRWAISRAAEEALDFHHIYPYIVAGVMINGKVRTCAAIASEDWDDHMPMPPKETIEKLKKMVKTTKEPRWFIHA
ncbi:hypothetical protein C8F04DRAFT_1242438 [Mycena alexandri]|uniref:Uncharacterized protein n=1 Tax=Mycena alexandri TaxID=1745969 RepID=A0AAD6S646_9AGAR|nr:hypothetical protein C8F04DRAFT_1242438 [Mycena alexandri]